MFFLLLLFIIIPIAELYIIIQVAQTTGVINSITLLILVSLIGAWLVRAQGTGVLNKIKFQLSRGEMPSRELADGGLILFAGALMLTPGFLTDAFGLLLLFPVTRPIFRSLILRRLSKNTSVFDSSNSEHQNTNFGNNSFIYFRNKRPEIVDLQTDQDLGNTPPMLEND